jgi:cytochrome c553
MNRPRTRVRAGGAPVGALAHAVAVSLALAGPSAARAGEPAAGRAKAASCIVCHGPLGISIAPEVPHIAGQPEGYLAQQLKAYRTGTRKNEAMTIVAKDLKDADIADLAAWFSAIVLRAEPPRK